MKRILSLFLVLIVVLQSDSVLSMDSYAVSKKEKEAKRQEKIDELQDRFSWWPTDAAPGPVKDEARLGYWWWPKEPGKTIPWGNRGYVYVRKIIFDYKEEELPPPHPEELRASLIIKKIIRNVKIYFDYDKADLRADHIPILGEAVRALRKNPEADILITGNCDRRGSEAYNQKLGNRRGEAVRGFMVKNGIPQERIRIISKGKLDAAAPVTDLVGMQKDRNAQFMIAEVEEVMVPYAEGAKLGAKPLGEGKYIVEKDIEIESQVKVSTREYVVKEYDTLRSIAQEQLGGAHRWKYLYDFNKGRIKNPDSLEAGTVIIIPIEQKDQEKAPRAVIVSPSSPPSARAYIINKNDSLWKIAQKQLGDSMRWKEIYELNKDKIKNPDNIIPGVEILIPE